MSPASPRTAHRARGFTLIEVLVALIVLSIGLLGVAALQLTSLRSNHSASLRSQATVLASDIIDRMRANQVAARAGEYDIALSAVPTAITVAGDDLVRWRQSLIDTLGPSADSSVVRNGAGSTATFIITIQWSDIQANGSRTGAPFSFAMETQI